MYLLLYPLRSALNLFERSTKFEIPRKKKRDNFYSTLLFSNFLVYKGKTTFYVSIHFRNLSLSPLREVWDSPKGDYAPEIGSSFSLNFSLRKLFLRLFFFVSVLLNYKKVVNFEFDVLLVLYIRIEGVLSINF